MVIVIEHEKDESLTQNPDNVTSMLNTRVKSFPSDNSPYTVYTAKDPTHALDIQFEDPKFLNIPRKRMDLIYFEVTLVESKEEFPAFGVGFGPLGIRYGAPQGMVGWFNDSIGYHGDDGNIIPGNVQEFAQNVPEIKAPQYGKGSVIGASWNITTGEVSYLLNGRRVDTYSPCKNSWIKKYDSKKPMVACVTSEPDQGVDFAVNNGVDLKHRPFLVDIIYSQFAISCATYLKYCRLLLQPVEKGSLFNIPDEMKHNIIKFLAPGLSAAEYEKLQQYGKDRRNIGKDKQTFLDSINPNYFRVNV